jgi:outer membrane lipoprotein-sorting protein
MYRHPAFILLIVGLLLVAGCVPSAPAVNQVQPTVQNPVSSSSTPMSTQPAAAASTAIPTPLTAPVLSADQVYQAVAAAWAKMDSAGARHVSQVSYKGDTALQTIEADSVPPNYHQVVTIMGKVMAEQYVYNGTIYNYVQGAWSQLAGAWKTVKSTLAGFSQALSDQIIKSDGKVVGVESVNGYPAVVYSYTTTLKGTSASSHYTLWVDQRSGLIVKQIIIDPQGEKMVQTIIYDASITLVLPDIAKNAKAAN